MDFDGFVITERLKSFGIEISEEEYINEINESGKDNSLEVTESIVIKRVGQLLEQGKHYDIKMLLFKYSHVINAFDREVGFKYRKYSMMFDHVRQLLASEIQFEVSYRGDNRCGLCSEHEGEMFNLEKEAVNPTIPIIGCINPHKICTATPLYHAVRDNDGRVVKHGKNYKESIKLKLHKD